MTSSRLRCLARTYLNNRKRVRDNPASRKELWYAQWMVLETRHGRRHLFCHLVHVKLLVLEVIAILSAVSSELILRNGRQETNQSVWPPHHSHHPLPPLFLAFASLLEFGHLRTVLLRVPCSHVARIAVLLDGQYIHHAVLHLRMWWRVHGGGGIEHLPIVDDPTNWIHGKPSSIRAREDLRPEDWGAAERVRRAFACIYEINKETLDVCESTHA